MCRSGRAAANGRSGLRLSPSEGRRHRSRRSGTRSTGEQGQGPRNAPPRRPASGGRQANLFHSCRETARAWPKVGSRCIDESVVRETGRRRALRPARRNRLRYAVRHLRQLAKAPRLSNPGFGQSFFLKRGIPAVHVVTAGNDWFQSAEMVGALAACRRAMAWHAEPSPTARAWAATAPCSSPACLSPMRRWNVARVQHPSGRGRGPPLGGPGEPAPLRLRQHGARDQRGRGREPVLRPRERGRGACGAFPRARRPLPRPPLLRASLRARSCTGWACSPASSRTSPRMDEMAHPPPLRRSVGNSWGVMSRLKATGQVRIICRDRGSDGRGPLTGPRSARAAARTFSCKATDQS